MIIKFIYYRIEMLKLNGITPLGLLTIPTLELSLPTNIVCFTESVKFGFFNLIVGDFR